MKPYLNSTLYFILIIVVCFSFQRARAGNFTWNGSQSSAWSTNANWTPNGIPSTNDTINVNASIPTLHLGQSRTISRIIMTGGVIDLDTLELSITQRASLNGGSISNGNLKVRGTYAFFQGTNFYCNMDVVSGQIKFSGGIFNQGGTFEQTGAASGWGDGGCTFNSNVIIKNAGATYLRMGQVNTDIFNGDVTYTCTGSYAIQPAYSDSTIYNGNIYLNSSGNGGIVFCNGANGVGVLASGKTIGVGTIGLTAGTSTLKNIIQQGNTAQTLNTTSTLSLNGCVFNGNITITAASLLVKGSTFNASATFTKTGNANNHWDGGNVFNGTTAIHNNTTGNGVLRMALQSGDVYAGNVNFNTSTGPLQVAFSGNNEFRGNININHNKVVFNSGSGTVLCAGSNAQTFGGSADYTLGKLTLNKLSNGITLQRAVTIDSSLTLTTGIIYTDTINLVTLKAGSTCSGASNLSYIEGPIKKIGNTAFEFPVGDDGNFKKLLISGVGSVTDAYICEFVNHGYSNVSHDTSLISINNCLYWSLERKVGTSTPQIKIVWSSNDCYIANPSTMRLAAFEGSLWKNKGYIQSTGTFLNGTVTGLNGNWNRYLTFANILDTATISNQVLLSEVGLFSLLDSINPPGELHVTGKVVSLWNGDVSSFGEISISDSVFTSYADEYLKISEALTGKNYSDAIINDGDSLIGGGYYYLNDDSLNQGLFLLGDSTDKFFIKGSMSLVIGNFAKVVLNGIKRENVVWVLNELKLDSNSSMYGIVFANNVELTKEHLGIIQLFSRNNLVFQSSETFNNAIYLKALNFINEDLRLDYNVINPQALPCNKILNGDLELGFLPTGINGIKSNNASFWDATAWINVNPCTSGGGGANTPDLLDVAFFPSSFLSCIGQNGGVGIPISFASNNVVDVRLPNSTRYLHSLESETANVQLDPSINSSPGIYLLEFYHSFGNCYTPVPGTSLNSCIGLLPIGSNITITPLLLANSNLNTFNWLGQNVTPGTWIQDLVCVDLSTSVIPNLATYNRIGIKPEVQGVGLQREIFFDDFQLLRVADAGPDRFICIGAGIQIGDFKNCLSSVSGVQVDYLWTASPSYSWASGQDILVNPFVSPTQTTVFTLSVTVTYPDGTTSCSDFDNMTVFVSNFSSPVVNFNLASPYSLCQGQTVNLCTTGTFVSYNWSTGQTTQCVTVSSAGTYSLTVVDQHGCSGSNSIVIVEIPCCSLMVDLTAENACLPATVGSITGDLTNGTAPYNIAWQQTPGTANGTFNTTANPFTIANLAPGTYAVTVTDVNNCTAIATVTILSGVAPPQASILGSTTTCVIADTYAVLNSSLNYTYTWSSIPPPINWPATQSQNIQITNQINPAVAVSTVITYPNTGSSYILQVVTTNNATGCVSTTLFPVNSCCHIVPSGLSWLNSKSSIVGSNINGTPGNCQNISLAGVFTVDLNTTWTNVCIRMDPGAEIRIQAGKTLTVNNSIISPCDDYFWKSITVNFGSLLQLSATTVLGAQYAIDVKAGGRYSISNNCNLFDDYVGLRVQGNSSNPNIRFIDDTFIGLNTTTTSLYPILIDFNGQTPPSRNTITCPAIPFAGIVLDFALNNQIGSTVLGNKLKIRDGMFGIYSTNTFLKVVNTNIENVQSDPCQPFNTINGTGIFASSSTSTGTIQVTDQGLGSQFGNTIKNCVTGIRTVGIAPIIRGNTIHQTLDGIHASRLPSFSLGNKMEVSDNVIEFLRFGVRILQFPANFRADFNRNVIYDYSSTSTLNGLNGALILEATRFAGSEVDINNKVITLNFTTWGTYIRGTAMTHVAANQINLDKNVFQRGITLGGCDDLFLWGNEINGSFASNPSSRLGITVTGCGNINQATNIFQCNHIINCGDHFSFSNPTANIDFDRNSMEIGSKGLRMSNVIFGNQLDKYNKWCGNFTTAAVDVGQGSFANFRIPAALPPVPPANCDYNPLNTGGVIGVGSFTLFTNGPNNNSGCTFVPQADTIYATQLDRFIADSLNELDLAENSKWQHRRLLAGKLVAQPVLLSMDSSMANFWTTNQQSEEVILAMLDDSIRNIHAVAQNNWNEITATLNSISVNNDSLAVLDSLMETRLLVEDSLAVVNAMNIYSSLNDTLQSQVDALIIEANELMQTRAVQLTNYLVDVALQSEQAQVERDFQLFALKYGFWSNAVISEQDTQLIVNLANLCMADFGFAVEWARNWYAQWYDVVIEDEDVCNNGNRIAQTDRNAPSSIDMLFFPNPTSESVMLLINGISKVNDANFVLELYNLEGKAVFYEVITSEKTNLVLDFLNADVYVAALKQNDQIVKRSKLVIVK